jgi:hypothetical protein
VVSAVRTRVVVASPSLGTPRRWEMRSGICMRRGRGATAIFHRFPSTAYVHMTWTLDEDDVDKRAGALVAGVRARERCAVWTGAEVLLAGKAMPICVEDRARGTDGKSESAAKYRHCRPWRQSCFDLHHFRVSMLPIYCEVFHCDRAPNYHALETRKLHQIPH